MCDDVDSPFAGALLEHWPSLEELRHSLPVTLRELFREYNCRSAEPTEGRIAASTEPHPRPGILRCGSRGYDGPPIGGGAGDPPINAL